MVETVTLRSARFRAEREADWRLLESLVTQAERRGLHRMDYAAARDLAAASQELRGWRAAVLGEGFARHVARATP